MTTWEEKIERRFQHLDELAIQYAEAKAEMNYLDDFRHSKIAILMAEAETRNPEKFSSAVSQEREARRHPEYMELLKGRKAATEKAEYALWKLRNAHKRIDMWQTRQADERAKLTKR